jgi:hypothetical protein
MFQHTNSSPSPLSLLSAQLPPAPAPTAPAVAGPRPLLDAVLELVQEARPACLQQRTFERLLALSLGHILAVGRRTITQDLVTLGLTECDWSAFYRLFSVPRVDDASLSRTLTAQALALLPPDEPPVVVLDGLQLPRHSRTMPGTSWLRHPETPPFRTGIQRRQRFLNMALLLPPSPSGYQRAVPLRLLPAVPAKAVAAAGVVPQTEGQAGVAALHWLRELLDSTARAGQSLIAVADGSFSNARMWSTLPPRVTLLARCAKNRALYALPQPTGTRGRPRLYGARQPRPDAWLDQQRGWQRLTLTVRGRSIPLTYRVEGPVLVKGAPQTPLFLLVVRGVAKAGRHKRREPAYWLVNAVQDASGRWRLPASPSQLLGWAWQRWEIEVTHREAKTEFGVGQAQCWSEASAMGVVQWQLWLYSLVILAGYRCWGLSPGPLQPLGRWRRPAGRWSLSRLLEGLRRELWELGEFRPVWTRSTGTWGEMLDVLALSTNILAGVRR